MSFEFFFLTSYLTSHYYIIYSMKPALVLAVFIYVVFVALGFAQTVHAQAEPPQQFNDSIINIPSSPYAPNLAPDIPANLHTYSQSIVIELLGSATCLLAGVNPMHPQGKCLDKDPYTGKLGYTDSKGGAIGLMGNLIASTFQIPVSSTHYFAYLGDNFGLTKKAYAQGYGFQSLSPLIGIWTVFRNLAYLLIVIFIVFVGLGIIFRVQIDPRTVMTVQNQIPKVALVLLFITFSFAIAGFLIDLMWISIYFIIGTFGKISTPTINLDPILNSLSGATPLDFVNSNLGGIANIMWEAASSVASVVSAMLQPTDATGRIIGALIGGLIGTITGGLVCSVLGPAAGWCSGILGLVGGITGGVATGEAAGLIARILTGIIIFIALLWALFRLWFALLRAYVLLLASILFSPLWIVAGLMPGSTIGIGAWLRDVISNLSAFPTTLILFLVGKAIIDGLGAPTTSGGISQSFFIPPFIGNPGSITTIKALIGVGIILVTPEVVNMVREALRAPEFKYVAAIGRSVGVGAAYTIGAPRSAFGLIRASQEPYAAGAPAGGGPPVYKPGSIWRAIGSRFGGR